MLTRGTLAVVMFVGCAETEADRPDAFPPPCVATSSCVDTGVVETTPRRAMGEACEADSECTSGLCSEAPSDRYCTEACERACPADELGAVYDCREGWCARRDFRWLVLVDTSEESEPLRPGADVCGVTFDCGDGQAVAEAAFLREGTGEVSATRGDAQAALDDGVRCVDESAPSDFVSLGVEGELALRFPRGLRGCEVAVTDRAGSVPESYAVYVCRDELRADCLNDGAPLWHNDSGGRHRFEVP